MRIRKSKIFVGDFETTVYEGQVNTEVWASACVELYSEDVKIFGSIDEQFRYFVARNENITCYYHNLKFDGSFWLSYLIRDLQLEQGLVNTSPEGDVRFDRVSDMRNRTFTYSISALGQWYRITIKYNNHIIELLDSTKLLPFSVKRIGESFGTKHKKLSIEYEGVRYAGCKISEQERAYIANDVLVVKEALEIMYNEKHTKMTIGSCCLSEYKKIIGGKTYDRLYPNMYDIGLNAKFGALTAGDYIKRAYRGGWCYLVKGKENKIKTDGVTADVNSLYPSVMHSESGNRYPIGNPSFWKGNFIPEEALRDNSYYFVRIRTRFYIKAGMLPFVQIKGTLGYKSTEMLETSARYNFNDGKYYEQYIDLDGNVQEAIVTLTLTMVDFKLFLEHYDVKDFVILDGCYFESAIGIFDDYIDKYRSIKVTSKGAKRELAKLFLNNLYGKMASSTMSNFKVAYLKDDKSIGFYTQLANDKKPGYIPVGAAITSYARDFTIRAAQKNYYGPNKPGFIYADTDSIHCDLSYEQLNGIRVHPSDFCCWKLEKSWDKAIFVRQKTYIEHVVAEDLIKVDNPYYSIKCAGMPDRCKQLFLGSIGELMSDELIASLDDDERAFIEQRRSVDDFRVGLVVPGKLLPKRIPGGVVLQKTTYEMR